MSYLGTDTREAGPEPFMYRGGNINEQHFDASCQPDNIIHKASDDSISVDISTEGSETNVEGLDLNRVPIMIGDEECSLNKSLHKRTFIID